VTTTRRRRRSAAATAIATAAALLLAACGNDTPETPDGSGGSSAPAGSGGTVDEAALELFADMTPAVDVDTSRYATDKTDLKIGYVDMGLVNSWRVQALGSAKQVAEQLGVELIPTDAGGDATKQISDAEDILASGVDALLVSPVSPESIAPIVERAYDSGIPVIVWGSEISTDKYTSKVVSDDEFFGYAGGKQLAEDLGGTGKVIMLRGIAGNSTETARYEGAVRAFEGTDIEIVAEEYGDWAFDQGKSITENLLAAHPQIDGVWSSGAAMTRGAIEAFQEAGRPLVPMSGENLNGYFKVAVDVGLKTSAPQFPTWMAPEAVKLAVRALTGMPMKDYYLLQPPAIVDIEGRVLPDVSDDYWVEDYLTNEQILEIFPN
jgi:ribose transport system substrate-binding protein